MVGASSVTKILSGASFELELWSPTEAVVIAFAAGGGDAVVARASPGSGVKADGLFDATVPLTWRTEGAEVAADAEAAAVALVGDGRRISTLLSFELLGDTTLEPL